VELTAYAVRDWRANFFRVGIAHSIVGGSAWESTPWRAVRRRRERRIRLGKYGKIFLPDGMGEMNRFHELPRW
jgi:hypothetical protein